MHGNNQKLHLIHNFINNLAWFSMIYSFHTVLTVCRWMSHWFTGLVFLVTIEHSVCSWAALLIWSGLNSKMSKNHLDKKIWTKLEKTSSFRVYKWFMQNWFSYFFSEDEEIVITSTSLNTEKLKREMIPWERQKEAQLEGKKTRLWKS